MKLLIKKPNLTIEAFNVFTAINSWKSELSGGYKNLFFFTISNKIIKRIKNKEFDDVKDKLGKELKIPFWDEHKILVDKTKKLHKLWKINKKDILNEFEKKFGFLDNEVKSYIIFSCGWGSYDTEKNEIYINYKMPLLYTLSHEICHLYYFNFLNKNFKKYNKVEAWKLSEVIVNFLLNRTELKKLWPKEQENYYNIKNIDKIWENWKNKNVKEFFNIYLKQ